MAPILSEFAVRLRALCAAETPLDDAQFNELARELFTAQFAANVPFRRLCEARGATPDQVFDWRAIPSVSTRAFKDLEITCLAPSQRARVFHSSGTTAQRPSRHFHSAESLAVYEASLRPWFRQHLLGEVPARPRCLSLTPPASAAPHSSLAHMLAAIAQEDLPEGAAFLGAVGADGSWTLPLGEAEAALRAAERDGDPVLLAGAAFSFVPLLDALAARGERMRLPRGSRIMETGGYKGRTRALPREALHGLLGERLGVTPERIVSEYGMSELSSQAYDQVAGAPESARRFRFPPWARALVVSPETGREAAPGEPGLLRVCDLANVFSVLAVQTEDLASADGDGFVLLGRAAQAEARGCSLLAADSVDNLAS